MFSCHRIYLDAFLERHASLMHGRVVDIGGTKVKKKGTFRPPEDGVQSWVYVNIDAKAEPDHLCDAAAIPVESESFNAFLLCEVLEHLEFPEAVLGEAARVLGKGGSGVITMPFLYPVHADPYDYQRWTSDKLAREISRAGLTVVAIEPLGGPVAVIHDLLLNVTWRSERRFRIRVLAKLLDWVQPLSMRLDKMAVSLWPRITGGWGAVVMKT